MEEDTENNDTSTTTSSVEDTVQFINTEVLEPGVLQFTGTSNVMVDQAAAMMVQDLRSFLQGTEQILLAAMGQAAKIVLEIAAQDYGVAEIDGLATPNAQATPATNSTASGNVITALTGLMSAGAQFSSQISSHATFISNNFGRNQPYTGGSDGPGSARTTGTN